MGGRAMSDVATFFMFAIMFSMGMKPFVVEIIARLNFINVGLPQRKAIPSR
jgi:hypothetical protein